MRRQVALLALARQDKTDLVKTLRTITETDARTIDIERVSVWRFVADRTAIVCEDLFRLGSGRHEQGPIFLARDCPSYFRALEESYTIAADDARSDPRTREFSRSYLEPNGITSMMDAPVWREGRLVGIVCHEHTGSPRVWAAEEQEFAGAVANMVSLTLETAERLEAEQGRRLLEQVNPLLRAVLDQMPAGFILAQAPSGRILLVNRAAYQISGRRLGETGERFAPDDPQSLVGALLSRAEMPLSRAIANGEAVIGEEMRLRRGDDSWGLISVNAAPVRNERGDIVAGVAVFEDLTERRLLEADRATGAHRDRFMGILGHDLRGPLAAASTAAQVLMRTEGACPGHALAAARIITSCGRMERMIHDLLDFARTSQGGGIPIALRPTELRALCRSIAEEAQATSPGRTLVLDAAQECWGEWDPERLAQVLSNLLANAVQHGAESQPITLRLDGGTDAAVLELHNEGSPIPEASLAHLFEPFWSLHDLRDRARPSGNLGLGLFISREIVRAHGGSIEARSSAQEGTTFTVRLPRHRET
ncbi:MAG: GAF domain-containing sensor histidine kinase [Deltaproteobacteria bacterium]|nr:GAF domain-containing sensor histidine kinase [Deltaproteobacteria bacterium]